MRLLGLVNVGRWGPPRRRNYVSSGPTEIGPARLTEGMEISVCMLARCPIAPSLASPLHSPGHLCVLCDGATGAQNPCTHRPLLCR